MARRKSELSVRGKRVKKKGKRTTDKEIDFSDIPELSDKQLKSMRRVGRPPLGTSSRQMIAIRLDPKVLEEIRKIAKSSKKGYQTLINEVLEKYVKDAA